MSSGKRSKVTYTLTIRTIPSLDCTSECADALNRLDPSFTPLFAAQLLESIHTKDTHPVPAWLSTYYGISDRGGICTVYIQKTGSMLITDVPGSYRQTPVMGLTYQGSKLRLKGNSKIARLCRVGGYDIADGNHGIYRTIASK